MAVTVLSLILARYCLDIFTPQNRVLGCRTEGWYMRESTFNVIWLGNHTVSCDGDYGVTCRNTPSYYTTGRNFFFYFTQISQKVVFAVCGLGTSLSVLVALDSVRIPSSALCQHQSVWERCGKCCPGGRPRRIWWWWWVTETMLGMWEGDHVKTPRADRKVEDGDRVNNWSSKVPRS